MLTFCTIHSGCFARVYSGIVVRRYESYFMKHLLFSLPLTCALLFVSALRSADDDPVVANKKMSEWLEILQNKSIAVKQRRAALVVLSIHGSRVSGTVLALIAALEDPEEDIRRGAAQTLGRMGMDADRAVTPLAEVVRADKADSVRLAAATALGRLGPKARPAALALAAALKDKHAGTRAAAAEAIGLVNAPAADVVLGLVEALGDADRAVRSNALTTLGRFDRKTPAAVSALANLLTKDEFPDIRRKAAESLGQLGADARAAVPGLAQALQDKDVDVRRWTAIALGKIGPAANAALPALAGALKKDPDSFVRGHAAHALGNLGKEAVPALLDCVLKEAIIEVRLAAIEALGNIGPDAGEAVKVLNTARTDGRASVREAAEAALEKITPKKE